MGKYCGLQICGRDLHNYIELKLVCSSFREPLTRIDQLKNKNIVAIRTDSGEQYTSWHTYKYLYCMARSTIMAFRIASIMDAGLVWIRILCIW